MIVVGLTGLIVLAGATAALALHIPAQLFTAESQPAKPRSLLSEVEGWRLSYSAVDKTGSVHLFVADADGRNRRQIDHIAGGKHQPNWSPDGKRIAFRWLPHDEDHTPLALIDADGSNFVNLTKVTGLRGWSPSWSPDGRRLVSAATPRAGFPNSLYVMSPDGSNPHRITPRGREAQYAAWSPDGRRIAFTYVVDGGFDLFTVRPDGTDLRRLTSEGAGGQNNWAMWSPDSHRIAWGNADAIWVMNTDGSHKQLVTRAGGVPGAWAPGPVIVFGCPIHGGKGGLCGVRPDGAGLTHLLGGAEASMPGWRPHGR
jgi:dipeptidyl aminopeptidase/acylaminoacyl peptidase